MNPVRSPPSLDGLLIRASQNENKPVAFVLAGHNGSGKTTLWHQRLARQVQLPLINADRLIASILPPAEASSHHLPAWAQQLRDRDTRWQLLAQESVRAFVSLVKDRKIPFAMETVFSHWKQKQDGEFESKADLITELQAAGYYCVLVFVGLRSVDISILRVAMRMSEGGHDVPRTKLRDRFSRTQLAVGHAASM